MSTFWGVEIRGIHFGGGAGSGGCALSVSTGYHQNRFSPGDDKATATENQALQFTDW